MKFCICCGHELPDRASFCSACGEDQNHTDSSAKFVQVDTPDKSHEVSQNIEGNSAKSMDKNVSSGTGYDIKSAANSPISQTAENKVISDGQAALGDALPHLDPLIKGMSRKAKIWISTVIVIICIIAWGVFSASEKPGDYRSWKEASSFHVDTNSVYAVSLSHDERKLAIAYSTSLNGFVSKIQIWDLSNMNAPTVSYSTDRINGIISDLSFSPGDYQLAFGIVESLDLGRNRNRVEILNIESKTTYSITNNMAAVLSIGFDERQNIFASTIDGQIFKFDTHTKEVLWSGKFSPPATLKTDREGRYLAIYEGVKDIKLYNLTAELPPKDLEGGKELIIAFSFKANEVATGSSDNDEIKIWDVSSGKLRFKFNTLQGAARALALSPGGKVLATGNQFGAVNLWDITNGSRIASVKVPRTVNSTFFLNNGKSLLVVDNTGDVIIFTRQ